MFQEQRKHDLAVTRKRGPSKGRASYSEDYCPSQDKKPWLGVGCDRAGESKLYV